MLAAVIRYAPAWVRYVLTLSEIARVSEGWVLASGSDIAIIDADGTSAMPLWMSRELAEGASADDEESDAAATAPEPLAISVAELEEKTLPSLAENGISVSVFPGPGTNRLIGAMGVARDLRTFVDDPRDVAGELLVEPRLIQPEGWANLEIPDPKNDDSDTDAAFWLLAAENSESVIGLVADEQPSVALFVSRQIAEAFADEAGVPATPLAARTESLVDHWLLMAFTAGWDAVIVTGDGEFGAVKPVRLALDLLEVAARAEAN